MRVRNAKDFWAGVIYLFFGASAVYLAKDYGMGTPTKMGAAYFPVMLGGLLAIIGAAAVVRSFFGKEERIGRFALKSLLIVFVATLLFAILLRGAGFIVAIIALALVGAYASVKFRLSTAIVLAAALAVFCVLVFVKGLGVPLPLLGSWFGG